jgi:hypothetical protein
LLKSANNVRELETTLNGNDRMSDLRTKPMEAPSGDDPLGSLHKMSTTAGLGTTEYAAVNGVSVIAVILGVAGALSLLDPVLLVIPLLTVILAIVAIWQVRHSNGTQTGTGLAILALILALGFCGLVGGRSLAQAARNRSDENAINDMLSKLDQALRAGKYADAYNAFFADKFTSRFPEQLFMSTWKPWIDGNSNFKGLTSIRSNGRMEFETNPDTGQKIAYVMTIMEFGGDSNAARVAFVMQKEPDGSWKISDIPDLFKAQAPPGARQR